MSLRLVAALLLVTLGLAGCFRQAGDNFQSVDSQSAGSGQAVPETPLPLPTEETTEDALLPVTETVDAPPVTVIVPQSEATATDVVPPEATVTDMPLEPTQVEPTEVQQQVVPSATTALELPTTVPTATSVTIITPGAPVQVEQPTRTPIPTETSTEDDASVEGLATPTALPEGVDSACSYTVRAGDNLFRIALRNNTTVDALQSFNSLPSAEVIQPGQVLQIPNCVPDDAEDVSEDGAAADSGIVHVVQTGETLGGIARRYGTTVDAILQLNPDITNPDVLSVGDEIAIPE